MLAEIKNKGVIGLIKITKTGEYKIEILPMQETELPLIDGEEVVISAE